ncbi:MAG TPA: Rrf2 family transcriptional regulator [Thermoclostridium caenicola]|uniref:Transcriptional regulator, BadM/Rrf2 family n=1 Tax=Thermoclostridium caenicola TaxID=659425 RepID=A0A1M6AQ42_9FIRM|nr:Rrf2 family transcriptional regulator [Thermoclostridium caenicola]SHI38596.1 transcriptional regulator, BadM/Rrf2 family [Thermoclostridium caenicola]HOK42377.1 Rrf2 family transcriptional regulator [Thermoclostridium caenicola]HOL85068.1 Rrf2 family transcriptional regulator [Thermoclostridium caenicola]HPO77155.1 Rrf2 family transcriptional regulator [Thermoclostridium caenicola]
MKISTRGRYALRLMLDLALNGQDQYVTIKSVAERQEISYKYLEQIITVLNKAGFVRSIRGAQGGYKLSRPPEEYTVGMILRQIEGNLVPVACMEDEPNQCPRSSKCVTLDVWKQLSDAINNVLDSITLADLVNRAHEKMAASE